MANDGFLYVGTVRQNTLGKPLKSKLLSEKDLTSEKRVEDPMTIEWNLTQTSSALDGLTQKQSLLCATFVALTHWIKLVAGIEVKGIIQKLIARISSKSTTLIWVVSTWWTRTLLRALSANQHSDPGGGIWLFSGILLALL